MARPRTRRQNDRTLRGGAVTPHPSSGAPELESRQPRRLRGDPRLIQIHMMDTTDNTLYDTKKTDNILTSNAPEEALIDEPGETKTTSVFKLFKNQSLAAGADSEVHIHSNYEIWRNGVFK